MAVYFIADLHFDDDNIRRYENRPFADVAEMNQALIENWNKTVTQEDTIYILGDIGNEEFLASLLGQKYLIKGNHDTKDSDTYRNLGFVEVYDLPVIYGNYFILSHEPLYTNRNMPYANLFGHVHNNPAYKTASSRSFCVSVERIAYTPISLEKIRKELKKQQEQEDA